MASLIKIAFIGCVTALFVASCDDPDSTDDFPSNIGLRGKVNVQNQYQQPLYEERDGISVLLETGFRSFPLQADHTGRYEISGAPVGTYTATYSKPGYGTIVQRGLKVSTFSPEFQVQDGKQVLPTVTLTKIPNTTFAEEALTYDQVIAGADTTYELRVSARIVPGPPPTGMAKGFRVFVGTDPLLSPQNYLYQRHHTTLTDTFSVHFGPAFLDTNGISSGDVIYAILYGDANFDVEQTAAADSVARFPNLSPEPSELTSIDLP